MSENDHAEVKKQLEEFSNRILEHVEGIEIFIQYKKADGSGDVASYETGRGNWFSRFAHVYEWVQEQKEIMRQQGKAQYREGEEL